MRTFDDLEDELCTLGLGVVAVAQPPGIRELVQVEEKILEVEKMTSSKKCWRLKSLRLMKSMELPMLLHLD